MTSSLEGALGTQRQFTRPPEGTYQKRLQNPNFGAGISMPKDYNTQMLMGALGLLGENILKESLARNNRAAKIGKAEGDYSFSVTNDEDKQKLEAIDILARSGRTAGASSNPYAIARVSELQGQYLRDTLEQDYKTWNATQELAKSSQEEAARYEKFMTEKLAETGAAERTNDKQNFQKGFYSEHTKNILLNDRVYHKKKDAEIEADSTTTLLAQVDKIAGDSSLINLKKPEEYTAVVGKLQENIFNSSMLVGKDKQQRYKMAELIGERLAESGNVGLLDAYGEAVVKFGVDGKETKVKDILTTWTTLRQKTQLNGLNIKGTAINTAVDNLKKNSVKDFDEEVMKLQTGQPEVFKAIKDKLGVIRNQVQEEENRRKREATARAKADYQGQVGNINNTRALGALERKWQAFENGNEITGAFELNTTSTYRALGANGKEEVKNFTEDQIMQFTMKKMQDILQQESDPIKAGQRQMKLIGFNPVGKVKQAIGANINQALTYGKNVERYLNMYRADASTFSYLFKDEAKDMQLLDTIVSNSDKGMQLAFEDYKIVKSRRDDPNQRRLVRDKLEDIERKTFSVHIDGLSMDKYKNPELWSAYEDALETSLYLGDGQAEKTATAIVQKNWSVLRCNDRKIAVPRSFYNKTSIGITREQCEGFLADLARDGAEPVFYNGMLSVGLKTYTSTEFIKAAIEYWQTRSEVEKTQPKPKEEEADTQTSVEQELEEMGINFKLPYNIVAED